MKQASVRILFLALVFLGATISGLPAMDMDKTLKDHVISDAPAATSRTPSASTAAPAASSSSEKTGTVRVRTSLNVRTSPWGSIIGSLHNGDTVRIISRHGDWYKISHNGATAYVHSNYVEVGGNSSGGSPGGNDNASNGGNTSDPGPAPNGGGSLQQRIVAAARNLVGVRNFPYAPGTQGGRLGCAQVVTTALKNAGAVNRVDLGVANSVSMLRGQGWREVHPPPWAAGDVVTWNTTGRPDSHIGIIMESGNSVQAMSNSSSQRMPRMHSATYCPVTRVLRKA